MKLFKLFSLITFLLITSCFAAIDTKHAATPGNENLSLRERVLGWVKANRTPTPPPMPSPEKEMYDPEIHSLEPDTDDEQTEKSSNGVCDPDADTDDDQNDYSLIEEELVLRTKFERAKFVINTRASYDDLKRFVARACADSTQYSFEKLKKFLSTCKQLKDYIKTDPQVFCRGFDELSQEKIKEISRELNVIYNTLILIMLKKIATNPYGKGALAVTAGVACAAYPMVLVPLVLGCGYRIAQRTGILDKVKGLFNICWSKMAKNS